MRGVFFVRSTFERYDTKSEKIDESSPRQRFVKDAIVAARSQVVENNAVVWLSRNYLFFFYLQKIIFFNCVMNE